MDGELLTPADFETDLFDDEPSIADWKLAQALDLRLNLFHELTERNRPDLEDFGNLTYRKSNSSGPGRPGREYRYNFNQAIYIVNRSEAKNAKAVQKHVVIIYGLWATGKLQPVDTKTTTAIAVATAQTFQQSPKLSELLLHDLLNEILTGQGNANDRLASVQRSAYEIQGMIGDIVGRRDASDRNIDIYDRVLAEFYVGRCPCCGKHFIIIDGKHADDMYVLDHATDNSRKNSLHEMWPVCKHCNNKFKKLVEYRIETMDAFRKFQRHVIEIIGQRLI